MNVLCNNVEDMNTFNFNQIYIVMTGTVVYKTKIYLKPKAVRHSEMRTLKLFFHP